jgi:sulfur carrier protein ThiS
MDIALAEALGIPAARVGRRPAGMQKEFEDLPEALKAPWATTPLGIALSAIERRGLPFAHFRVNEQRVQVINLNQSFSAFDALVAAGKELNEFYARPGMALTYEFNGQARVVKGSPGSSARLFVNGAPAAVDAHIKPGDALVFVAALAGQDGKIRLSQALENEGVKSLHYSLNGEAREFPAELALDGKAPVGDPWLEDRARVSASFESSAEKLLRAEGADLSGLITRSIAVTVNGEPRVITQRNYSLVINGAEASIDALVNEADGIEFDPSVSFQERVRDLIASPPRPRIKVKVNGLWQEIDGSAAAVHMNGREVSPDEFLIDGAEIKVADTGRHVSVVELLAQLPFDNARLTASHFELKVNGAPAPYHAVLNEGDEIEVHFDASGPQLRKKA